MKHMPSVTSVMTPFPYSIEIDEYLHVAESMMAKHDIKHLPIKQHGKLVSVITDHDIKIAMNQDLNNTEKTSIKVADLYLQNTCVASITERLDSVLLHMAKEHVGSTLVVKDEQLVGIITATDVCRSFGKWLQKQFPTSDNNTAA